MRKGARAGSRWHGVHQTPHLLRTDTVDNPCFPGKFFWFWFYFLLTLWYFTTLGALITAGVACLPARLLLPPPLALPPPPLLPPSVCHAFLEHAHPYLLPAGIAAVNMTPSVPLSNVLCSFFFGERLYCLGGPCIVVADRCSSTACAPTDPARFPSLCPLSAGFWNLLSGFLLPIPAMPGYWVWAAWINPVMW